MVRRATRLLAFSLAKKAPIHDAPNSEAPMLRCICVSLTALGLAFAALFVIRPCWATTAGLDVWNLRQLARDFDEQRQLAEKLEEQKELVLSRIAAKEAIIHDLVTDEITLVEAAARFRHVKGGAGENPESHADYFAGRTENERCCRQVLQWVRAETETWTPSEAEKIRARLTAELEAHLAIHHGVVVLPKI
jgi:hypothetical protein